MRWIDATLPLRAGMPAFPGDPEFAQEPILSVGRGDPYSVSRITLGSHTGTHVDPPRHFRTEAAGADRMDLTALVGPCVVVQIPALDSAIFSRHLDGLPAGVERLLFRTSNSERWAAGAPFFPDYVALDPSAAESLVARQVRLVGIDALSIESDRSDRYPVHRTLLDHGIVVLEGLDLHAADPGPYELLCLPLPVVNGDGAPARVVLRSEV